MRRIALAIVLTVLGSSAASAFCQPVPDTSATYNVQNNTAQALCLQQELARQTAMAAEQARIDAMIAGMRIEAEREQRMLRDRLNLQIFGQPAF